LSVEAVTLLLQVAPGPKYKAALTTAGACPRAGRHDHHWKVWRDVKLPEGKILIPGIVSHATNVVKHPEVVADRILNFASVAGRENIIAGTDCGLGGRIHPQLVWAKLEALVAGARLATDELRS